MNKPLASYPATPLPSFARQAAKLLQGCDLRDLHRDDAMVLFSVATDVTVPAAYLYRADRLIAQFIA